MSLTDEWINDMCYIHTEYYYLAIKKNRCTEQTLGLREKARVGCSERIALKQVYYQGWNRSPAQVECKRQVLRAGALGRPRGMGWGTHLNPWLIHVNVWQKPLQYCKVISLQLTKINEKNKTIKNKKNKILTYTMIQMNIENIMLSERPHIVWFHSHKMSMTGGREFGK